ncbi:MAG: site-specific integrase [Dyadobacter sp.]|uniref:tyrosine-type recombinase/integrase n=1 Tax=Dyadobacter sp. TaxID=1914288 RepID=UPI001B1D8FC9|nr:phage integrase SAM-like domain-containing protein [Dyadobacter sp.]MBO9613385.1 site-specific integrase [Dyadobacter sp.]
MATVNFYLKEANSDKKTPINLSFSFGAGSPFKYATGFSVLPSDWSTDKQRVREKRSVPEAAECNAYLNRVEATINQVYFRAMAAGDTITRELLRELMDQELDKATKRKKVGTFMAYLDYIVDFKKNIGSSDRWIVEAAVINIKEYAAAKKKKLNFSDITLAFRDEFNSFLEEKGYKQNSISTYFAALRIILIQAQEDGINPYNHFRSKKFSAKKEKVKRYALKESELIKIYEVDLSGYPRTYEDTRDTFLIGAFSLMRVSDYSKLEKGHFQDGKIYRKTQKTGTNVVIPVHWVVSEILKKRNGELPQHVDRMTINIRIKEIAKLAGINSEVVVTYTKGGKRVHEVKSKAETITSHTARRSGATNMIKRGIARSKVMTIGGWATEEAFNKYLDMSEEETADELASHPFFQKLVTT